MRRLAALLVAAALAGLALVSAASADKPERFFLPASDSVLSCPSFDVRYEIVDNNEFGTVFSDGRFLVTGTFKIRLTNLSDPTKSLEANISGPGVVTPTADGGISITAWGRWLFWFFPGMLGPGSPAQLLLTSGLATETIDAAGNITSFTPARNTADACPLLS
jgi:hypothetical protein